MDTTDKRLLTLFSFDAFSAPISREQIVTIIASATQLSWIDIQLTIEALIEDNLLLNFKDNRVELSPEGKQIVNLYQKNIPLSVRENIKNYIKSNKDQLLRETLSLSNFEPYKENFKVQLELIENSEVLLELSLLVPDRANAEMICNNWKSNSQKIYKTILDSFSKIH